MFETVLDNQIETVQDRASFFDGLLEKTHSAFEKLAIANAIEKRARKNERRFKIWTGERYVKVEAAD
jgi:hypothetical protein